MVRYTCAGEGPGGGLALCRRSGTPTPSESLQTSKKYAGAPWDTAVRQGAIAHAYTYFLSNTLHCPLTVPFISHAALPVRLSPGSPTTLLWGCDVQVFGQSAWQWLIPYDYNLEGGFTDGFNFRVKHTPMTQPTMADLELQYNSGS
jgi:hypothetical protein